MNKHSDVVSLVNISTAKMAGATPDLLWIVDDSIA